MLTNKMVCLVVSLLTVASASAVPMRFSYGGRLMNGEQAVAGPVDLDIRFYATSASTTPIRDKNGQSIVAEFGNVLLEDGVFQVTIGVGAPLSEAQMTALMSAESLYVEVTDKSSNKTYPRQLLVSMPFAMRVPTDDNLLRFDDSGKLTLNVSGTPSPDSVLAAGATGGLEWQASTGQVSGSAISGGTIGGDTAIDTTGKVTGAETFTVTGTASVSGQMRFGEKGGNNYVALKAPDSLNTDKTWILPAVDGTSGQFLQTNGSGQLSWGSPSVSGGLIAASNLADLTSKSDARNNLGLGSLATMTTVSGAEIANSSITDADLAATAGISSSKISFAADSLSGDVVNGGVISNFASTGIDDNATSGTALTIDAGGNIGIGTNAPDARLDINGSIKIRGGSPAAGKVLTSDANGLATWQTPDVNSSDIMDDAIMNVDISSTAAIDARKIANGAVSSTQFEYLSTVTSDVQTQINQKLNLAAPVFTGSMKGPDGGTNAPTYSFSNSGTTGLFSPTTSALGFSTGGVERLRVTSSGSLGIGTSIPDALLHVAGNFKLGNSGGILSNLGKCSALSLNASSWTGSTGSYSTTLTCQNVTSTSAISCSPTSGNTAVFSLTCKYSSTNTIACLSSINSITALYCMWID